MEHLLAATNKVVELNNKLITMRCVDAVDTLTEQRDRMAEILRDILAYDKGDKPHDYWTLHNLAQENAMAFDAWQEILRKIEEALETKP